MGSCPVGVAAVSYQAWQPCDSGSGRRGDSLGSRDYPVQLGLLVISAFLIVLGNLIADLIYGFLDPRITYR